MSIQIRRSASCGMRASRRTVDRRSILAHRRMLACAAHRDRHPTFTVAVRSSRSRVIARRRASGSRARQIATSRRIAIACPPRSPSASALAAHHKAADYTIAKQRAGRARDASSTRCCCVALTLGGGLARADRAGPARSPFGPLWQDVAADRRGRCVIGGVVSLPFSWYAHVRHRGALRLQPDDAGAVARRPRQGHRRRRRPRPAAAAARALADARRRRRCGGCGPGPRGWPSSSCCWCSIRRVIAPLFNKFDAAARRRGARAHRSAARALRLRELAGCS